MARLIDDIRSGCAIETPRLVAARMRERWAAQVEQFRGCLMVPDLPVIRCNHVSRYYFELSGQEYWNLQKDFTDLRPVYAVAWFEHGFPRRIHSDILGDSDASRFEKGRSGWLVFTVPVEDVKGDGIPAEARWILSAAQFVDYGDGRVFGPLAMTVIAIDAGGVAIGHPSHQAFTEPGKHDEEVKVLSSWLNPVLLTICMMHRQPSELDRRSEVEVYYKA